MARFVRQNGKLVNANAQAAVAQPQAEHPQWWTKGLKLCFARYEQKDDLYLYLTTLNTNGGTRPLGVRKSRDDEAHTAQRLHLLKKGCWYHFVLGPDRWAGYTGASEIVAVIYTPMYDPRQKGLPTYIGRVTNVVSTMPFKVESRACECHQMSLNLAGYDGIAYKTMPSLWQPHATDTIMALKGKKVAAVCGPTLVMGVSELEDKP